MDVQQIITSLDVLRLDELRLVQARVNALIAQLEQQASTAREADPSYQAYQAMRQHAPDLGKK